MRVQFKGIIKNILPKEQITDNFTKSEIHLEIGGDTNYPSTISINFANKFADLPSNYKIGDNVQIDVQIKGNESKGRVYNQFSGFSINLT